MQVSSSFNSRLGGQRRCDPAAQDQNFWQPKWSGRKLDSRKEKLAAEQRGCDKMHSQAINAKNERRIGGRANFVKEMSANPILL